MFSLDGGLYISVNITVNVALKLFSTQRKEKISKYIYQCVDEFGDFGDFTSAPANNAVKPPSLPPPIGKSFFMILKL